MPEDFEDQRRKNERRVTPFGRNCLVYTPHAALAGYMKPRGALNPLKLQRKTFAHSRKTKQQRQGITHWNHV